MEKKWRIKGKFSGNLLESLLEARGLSKGASDFLNPPHPQEALEDLELDLSGAVRIIRESILLGKPIFIHGDYDVDGLCATTILYKTIRNDLAYHNCFYFIPDRFEDSYGLTRESVDKIVGLRGSDNSALIVTVDCGITALEAVFYAKSKGFSLIISDHHKPLNELPAADTIVWTEKLTGAGIAFALSRELLRELKPEYLALSALATVADIQPLLGANRSMVKFGMPLLPESSIGIKALREIAGTHGKLLSTYELGWVISPRLNASGRLESAYNSLKLLLSETAHEALSLARALNGTNAERQKKMLEMVEDAKARVSSSGKVIVIGDESFHEGIIGLVAGKLVQHFYKPSVVISVGDEISKGSARSVEGVSIIDLLREAGDIYESLGGHSMAAGFSLKTERIDELKGVLGRLSESLISEDSLKPYLDIDLEIPAGAVSSEALGLLEKFEPFGFGNPEPVFVIRNFRVVEARQVGANGDHLKLRLFDNVSDKYLNAIYFGGGKLASELSSGRSLVDVAFSLRENVYNGSSYLDLHIKDIKLKTAN